jgi:hypothetical protein
MVKTAGRATADSAREVERPASTHPARTPRLELPHDQLDDPPFLGLASSPERLGQRLLDDVAPLPASGVESIIESITSASFRTLMSTYWRGCPLPTPLKTAQNPSILVIAPGFKSRPPR